VLGRPLLSDAAARRSPGELRCAFTLLSIPIPSTTLGLTAWRWGARRRETRGVRAFVAGIAPITIGLLLAAATVVAQPYAGRPRSWVLIAGGGAAGSA
jgi:chromate transporter